jgi:membrane-associated phospholipid phosphatase
MGQVFLAEDTRLERKTALKVLSPDLASDAERLKRFRREAKAIASLNHPNIVTIYSVEEAEGVHFFTMELVEGKTLTQMIPAGTMPVDSIFDVSVQVADALAAAHERGIIHRDLKPANVMMTEDGWVKVLDFGLAKLRDETPASTATELPTEPLTEEGRILGTLPYMSPEQLRGDNLDPRSDIFSFGVILYEMATGERPFKGDSSVALMCSILTDIPREAEELRTDLPHHLSRIIRHCLAKDLRRRFQSVIDVRNELEALTEEIAPVRVTVGGESSGTGARTRVERSWPALRAPGLRELVSTRAGLTGMLALIFGLNFLETALETKVKGLLNVGQDLADRLVNTLHWMEGGLSFENHDATSTLAVYGHSLSYFFVFPLLAVGTALALAGRRSITPYRVFCFAIAFAYGLSLPFFLFFPVPERWSYPESGATLLSDLWSSKLIETVRPISGLDNCFPSFHVSLTVVFVLVCFMFQVRLRNTVLFLGLTVLLSTFVLGIHWLADIVVGLSVGVLSIALARRVERAVPGRA